VTKTEKLPIRVMAIEDQLAAALPTESVSRPNVSIGRGSDGGPNILGRLVVGQSRRWCTAPAKSAKQRTPAID
jgi:hypothetical protein